MRSSFTIVLAALICLACGAGGNGIKVPENSGPVLTPDPARGGKLVWAKDDSEVFYSSPVAVKAVRVADFAVRPLALEGGPFLELTLSPDGSALYAVDHGAIHGFGVIEVLSARRLSGWPFSYAIPHNIWEIAVSPDGNSIAFENDGGISLYQLATGLVSHVPGCGPLIHTSPSVAMFSPSGQEILCKFRSNGPDLATIVNLATGASRPVHISFGGVVRWDGSGLHVLHGTWNDDTLHACASRPSYCIDDVASGETRAIAALDVFAFMPGGAASSGDGRTIALWEVAHCSDQPAGFCQPVRAQLRVVDLASGHVKTLASGTGVPGALAFSNDGNKLAYILGSTIRMRPLR